MLIVDLILYILAAICFLLYAIAPGFLWPGNQQVRVNLLGLGVFFWSLVPLIETVRNL